MPTEGLAVTGRLNLYFALLSCLGGVVLGTSPETEALPVLAVFFAAFGFVFVDTLKLFALPLPLAYAAMGLSAAYCVLNFTDLERPGNPQIVSVAELLVMVQGILMLQKKNRRIYEQLGVFCLLQLVVAAVFSDAIHYGLMLVPIGVVGLLALGALAVLASVEPSDGESPKLRSGTIRCSSHPGAEDLSETDSGRAWVGILVVAPAVVLIGSIFFYALPRTMEAPAAGQSGNVMIGFNDEVRLEQFGQMLQKDDVALRVRLTDRETGAEYRVADRLYLRGKVLERYQSTVVAGRPTANWSAVPLGRVSRALKLPPEFVPPRKTDRNFYDAVIATITCEPMRSPALFTVVPYHGVDATAELSHEADRWTIHRRLAELEGMQWSFPRMKYQFGTNAFRNGIQTELTRRFAHRDRWMSAASNFHRGGGGSPLEQDRRDGPYRGELLQLDRDAMPTVVAMAKSIVEEIPAEERTTFRSSQQLEQWLKYTGGFEYTLNLNAEPVPGMDPIEQFLSVDQQGHCQYFASALTMMLRSLDIPARLVVGYQTDEYSELGKSYLARQYHAHAWVEALIDRDELPEGTIVYGQAPSNRYWLRLDPSPAGGPGSQQDPRRVGSTRQVFDMAQNLWDEYVVEMDRDQQREKVLDAPGMAPLTESYREWIDSMRETAQKLRRIQWWEGAFTERPQFSLPAAIGAVLLTLAVMALFRIRIYRWIRRHATSRGAEQVAVPSLSFYAEAMEQLARLGLYRRRGETPAEFTREASATVTRQHRASLADPLDRLTSTFYRLRFGMGKRGGGSVDDVTRKELRDLKRRVDLLSHPVDRDPACPPHEDSTT